MCLLILWSCEDLNEPVDLHSEYSIVACFDPADNLHRVYAYHNAPLSEYVDGVIIDDYFVNEADITLKWGNEVFNDFLFHKDSTTTTYYYSYGEYNQKTYYGNNSELEIIPGMEYELTIKINDSEFTGNMSVPGNFELSLPARDTMKAEEINELEFEWTESINSSVYVYGYRTARPAPEYYAEYSGIDYFNFPEGIPREGDYTYERKVKFDFYGNPFTVADSVLIFVSAFDKNTSDHILKGRSSAGLTNALGVFGSSVTKTAVIVIEKE